VDNDLNDGNNTETVIIDTTKPLPDDGITPGGGGSIGDTTHIDDSFNPIHYPGGESNSTNADRNTDTLIVPGPNTEDRTAGDLISEAEDNI
jgi:hypothetical protein